MMWAVYFGLFAGLTGMLLLYAFWASGYLGGPKPDLEDAGFEAPHSFGEKLVACCTACCCCVTPEFSDSTLCLWSFILLLQVVVLTIFLVSLFLCIVAGVQALLV